MCDGLCKQGFGYCVPLGDQCCKGTKGQNCRPPSSYTCAKQCAEKRLCHLNPNKTLCCPARITDVWSPDMTKCLYPDGKFSQYEQNRRAIHTVNTSGAQLNFVLYGDSITAFVARNPVLLPKHFPGKRVLALGVDDSTVRQLAHRIMSGDELPARAPKCIAFNIGVNDTQARQQERDGLAATVRRMEALLQYMKATFPTTKLVLMALLPTSRPDRRQGVAELNIAYKSLAARMGIMFSQCGQHMNPTDSALYSDGLHLTQAGHDVVLACLRQDVAPFI